MLTHKTETTGTVGALPPAPSSSPDLPGALHHPCLSAGRGGVGTGGQGDSTEIQKRHRAEPLLPRARDCK